MTMKTPTQIKLHALSKMLEVQFEDETFELPCEYLRVYSPSAEVRGHGGGPMQLVTGKADVNIVHIEPVGYYAVKLTFSDGHDTGLYSWDVLYELGKNQQEYWQHYLARLKEEGKSRAKS